MPKEYEMSRALMDLVFVLCVLPVPVAAQPPVEVAMNQRVRVTTSDRGAVTGRLLAVTPDALQLLTDSVPDPVTIQRASVTRIDISRGRAPRGAAARRGAIRGALILGSIGAVSLALQHQEVQASTGGVSVPHAAALGAWSGGLFGALFGAVVGAARAGERWEPISP
jgi:hypothetical protein